MKHDKENGIVFFNTSKHAEFLSLVASLQGAKIEKKGNKSIVFIKEEKTYKNNNGLKRKKKCKHYPLQQYGIAIMEHRKKAVKEGTKIQNNGLWYADEMQISMLIPRQNKI